MALPMNADTYNPDDRPRQIARVIRGLLGLYDWEQRDLADKTGISADKLTKSMKGQRRWQIAELEAIARAFDLPVSVILDEPTDLVERVRTGRFPLAGIPTPPQLELPFAVERELAAV